MRVKSVHLGWDKHRSCYHIWIPEINRLTQSIHLDFHERSFTELGPSVSAMRLRNRKTHVLPAARDPDAEPAHAPPTARASPDARTAVAGPAAAMLRAPARDPPLQRAMAVPIPAHQQGQLPQAVQMAQPATRQSPRLLLLRDPGADDASRVHDYFTGAPLAEAARDHDVYASIDYDEIFEVLATTEVYPSSSMGEFLISAEAHVSTIPVPTSARMALTCPVFSKKWRESMISEVKGKFITNGAWKYVMWIPEGRRCMKGKWIFKIEYNDDESIKRFKARWVACGYSQIEGIDFQEIYSSTLPIACARLFFAAAVVGDWEIEEIDTIKAFTQATFAKGEELYIEQPHFMEVADERVVGCLMLSPLEGTKQAGYLYQKAVRVCVTDPEGFGATQSMTEPNVYWKTRNKSTLRICVYVDNMLLGYDKTVDGAALAAEFKVAFAKRFKIELRGPPTKFLGMEVERTAKSIKLTQNGFIMKAAAKFLATPSTAVWRVPVNASRIKEFENLSVAQDASERAQMADKPYLPLVGTLLWATLTHPEVSYTIAYLCQFMHDPSLACYDAAQNVLTYLNGAKHLGITYEATGILEAYSDASWNNEQSAIPFGGHAVFFGGAAVCFAARKLKIAPQSSAEAETAAYSKCCRDVMTDAVNVIGRDGFQMKITLPVTVNCDNSAAVLSITHAGSTARNRHYERPLQYGKEQFIRNISQPVWISTTLQVADIFTKSLDITTFRKFRAAMLNMPNTGNISYLY